MTHLFFLALPKETRSFTGMTVLAEKVKYPEFGGL